MKSYKTLKKELFKDKAVLKAYNELEPEYTLIRTIINKRIKQGLTQSELAKKAGTKQSAISRLEGGSYNPTVAFLHKIANALELKLKISLF